MVRCCGLVWLVHGHELDVLFLVGVKLEVVHVGRIRSEIDHDGHSQRQAGAELRNMDELIFSPFPKS